MKHVTPKMFDDLFDIVLDPVFERMTNDEKNAIWEQGNFDLLYSRSRSVNKRRPLQDGIYPVKEKDPRTVTIPR